MLPLSALRCTFKKLEFKNYSYCGFSMNQPAALNLARKWRSKDFDHIVGQDLSVRMLKNSLYAGHFFPVYLFAGQRGCGKTTTARVFATAVNCMMLSDFQKDPRNTIIPCLTCTSCVAMTSNTHPDFIEIDAASHTGVDNVRSIIDAASLLPLMGKKKIYLIDEAHMLSKAAFNAFLKILEEPPVSVLFILATTDTQKIIETVRSRCFQLLFGPIESNALLNHLTHVCQTEQISYDQDGLSLIIQETEGSVRDALNLLEQVRFSSSRVSKDTVKRVLGHIDDQTILNLFQTVLTKKPSLVLQSLSDIQAQQCNPLHLYRMFVDMTRASLWIKYGVETELFAEHKLTLQRFVRFISAARLTDILAHLYNNQELLQRTTMQFGFLEMILLHIAQNNDDSDSGSSVPQAQASSDVNNEIEHHDDVSDDNEQDDDSDPADEDASTLHRWSLFVQRVSQQNDPLVTSIFTQGSCGSFDAQAKKLTVIFAKEFSFFNEWIDNTRSIWQPILEAFFNVGAQLDAQFSADSKTKAVAPINKMPQVKAAEPVAEKKMMSVPVATHKPMYNKSNFQRTSRSTIPTIKEPIIDVSNAQEWPKASLLLQQFPGTITHIQEINA